MRRAYLRRPCRRRQVMLVVGVDSASIPTRNSSRYLASLRICPCLSAEILYYSELEVTITRASARDLQLVAAGHAAQSRKVCTLGRRPRISARRPPHACLQSISTPLSQVLLLYFLTKLTAHYAGPPRVFGDPRHLAQHRRSVFPHRPPCRVRKRNFVRSSYCSFRNGNCVLGSPDGLHRWTLRDGRLL